MAKQQTMLDRIFNDILMDLKLANHVIKKNEPGVEQLVLSSILQQADLVQVSQKLFGSCDQNNNKIN